MALKIKQNGQVKDLIIPACGVQILDMEDNFESSNLEEVLQEIGEGESVYISDEEPDKDGIWISSDNTNIAGENPTLVTLKSYIDEKLGTAELTTDDKTIKGAINEHEIQINDLVNKASQLSNPNLLINGDFQVWQRGTSFIHTHANFCADRWQMFMAGSNNKAQWNKLNTKGGIKLTIKENHTEKSAIRLWYTMEEIDRLKLIDKNMTFTIRYRTNMPNGHLLLSTGTNNINLTPSSTFIEKSFTQIYKDSNKQYFCGIIGVSEKEYRNDYYLEVEWIKVEVGSKGTPFIPRLYGEELNLCQRYYQVTTLTQNVIASDNSQLQLGINGIPMRIKPTTKYLSKAYAHSADTGTKVITLCSDINKPETTLDMPSWIENGTTFALDIRGLTASDVANGQLWTINNSNGASNRLSGFVKVAFDAEIY